MSTGIKHTNAGTPPPQPPANHASAPPTATASPLGGSINGPVGASEVVYVLPVPHGGAIDNWAHPFMWSVTDPLFSPCRDCQSPLPAPFADDTDRMVVLAGNKLFAAPAPNKGGRNDDGRQSRRGDPFEEKCNAVEGNSDAHKSANHKTRTPEVASPSFAALKAANDHFWRAVPRRRPGDPHNSSDLVSGPRSASYLSPSASVAGNVLLLRHQARERRRCVSDQSGLCSPSVVLGLGGLYKCGGGSGIDSSNCSVGGPRPPIDPNDKSQADFSQQSLNLVVPPAPPFAPMSPLAVD